MTTIIFAHPWHGSFNKAVLDLIAVTLAERGDEYTVIDLLKDGFNPAISEQELALYNQGKFLDPLVGKYQELIKNSDRIIFLFPVWWGSMPAILKGFFDKVWLKGFSHNYDENGNLQPLLSIGKSYIFTTSQAPTELFKSYMTEYFKPFFMDTVGINNAVWLNCDQASYGPQEHRQNFLGKIKKLIES